MSNDLGGFLFNDQKRPESGRQASMRCVREVEASIRTPTATSIRAAWTDPGPLQFGNAVRRDGTVRGFPNYSEDLNIFKVFPMADQRKMRLEASIGNIFNRVVVLRSEHELELRQPSARSTRNVTSRGRCSSH